MYLSYTLNYDIGKVWQYFSKHEFYIRKSPVNRLMYRLIIMTQEIIMLPKRLKGKFVVLVGLMGAGKTKLGRIIAGSLSLPFVDTDKEIEKASGYTVPEIFERYGEKYFRDGERRVIERILSKTPSVLATGGGAYMNENTRRELKKNSVTIWLRADLDLLVQRTENRADRPLLKKGHERKILAQLMKERYPIYADSDFVVDVNNEPAAQTAKRIINLMIKNTNPSKIL